MMVSIAITTFNQEAYIQKALDSMLAQQVSFDLEIVISDDLSTDTTRAIIRKFQEMYPRLVKDVSPESNIGMTENFNRVLGKCSGEYIALCDGDDYWTDSQKLQKQIDFMQNNPTYSFCCHGYSYVNEIEQIDDSPFVELTTKFKTGFDITLLNFFNKWVTKSLTVVFRSESIALPIRKYEKVYDMVLFVELLLTGNARWMNFNGGNYRIHRNNYWNSLSQLNKYKKEYYTFVEFYRNHPKNRIFLKGLLRSNVYVLRELWKHRSSNFFLKETIKFTFLFIKNIFGKKNSFFLFVSYLKKSV